MKISKKKLSIEDLEKRAELEEVKEKKMLKETR